MKRRRRGLSHLVKMKRRRRGLSHRVKMKRRRRGLSQMIMVYLLFLWENSQ
jgi:hypothetical protein